jgi:menaquinone-dependent protoporphyrinogen oxidase
MGFSRLKKSCKFTFLQNLLKMADKILITYASRSGFTAGVADAIGKTLIDHGEAVDILRMQDVKDLTIYKAVVAGSSIQEGKWLPEALEFIQTYRSLLSQKPFAVFVVCMTLAMPKADKYRYAVAAWLDSVRSLVKPVSEGLFAGGLSIGKIPSFGDRFKFRLSVMFGVWKEGDHRDWKAISDWAKSLVPLLQSVPK